MSIYRLLPISLVLFFLILLLVFVTPAHAYPEGILGHHGAERATCTRCHNGGVAPDVALVGSSQVMSGSTVLYTLIITSNAPNVQQTAGFNLVIEPPSGGAYATGLASVDATVKAEFSELAHTAPKINDADGVARFDFEWVVPAETGNYTIYYAGNSTNGNGATSGDMSMRRTQTLTVVDNTAPLTVDVREAKTAVRPDSLILIFLCLIATASIVTMKRHSSHRGQPLC